MRDVIEGMNRQNLDWRSITINKPSLAAQAAAAMEVDSEAEVEAMVTVVDTMKAAAATAVEVAPPRVRVARPWVWGEEEREGKMRVEFACTRVHAETDKEKARWGE